ncbi:MAG: glycosyltransferase [Prevotella sp.]|nr:glycosyltransferase [Prevotella sp.]
MPRYSVIIPVYNRPEEVGELLQSLIQQTEKDFEVVVIEDGSAERCDDVCARFAGSLDLHYHCKPNGGPGEARNFGAGKAHGDYLLIVDSDVVLPENYIANITKDLQKDTVAFGGSDRSHPSFTPVQKAISYAMTSFFTTGGIRGGKKKLDKFYPRSFNMGIRRDVYQQLGGFSKMRFGEDIDFSYRICEAGYDPQLLPNAWVWHKRRTDFRRFFKQVYNSGIARISLGIRHPGTTKPVHWLPALFTTGVFSLLLLALLGTAMFLNPDRNDPASAGHMTAAVGFALVELALLPVVSYSLLIFFDSSIRNRSLRVGLLSIPAAFVQLTGYGLGFLHAFWKRRILRQSEFTAFEHNFYQ